MAGAGTPAGRLVPDGKPPAIHPRLIAEPRMPRLTSVSHHPVFEADDVDVVRF